MMGVICASDGAVKGAGHQQDKYKLKLMQVSFLLDQFVFGGCTELGMVLLPFVPFQFRARRQKLKIEMYLPEDAFQYHRLDNKAQKPASTTVFLVSKLSMPPHNVPI